MVSEWNQIIGTIRAIGIWDFVDIAIVAVLIYQVIKLIRETRAEGRKRSYILTEKGRETLEEEYRRLCAQAADYRRMFGEEEPQ